MLSSRPSRRPTTEIKQGENAMQPPPLQDVFFKEDVVLTPCIAQTNYGAYPEHTVGVAQQSLMSSRCCVIICHCALRGEGEHFQRNPMLVIT